MRDMGVEAGDEVIVELAPRIRNAPIWLRTSPLHSRLSRPPQRSTARWRSSAAGISLLDRCDYPSARHAFSAHH
jgi:hypothetical protein